MESELTCTTASIVFEPGARRLSIHQRPLQLTSIEYEILACLARHGGEVVSRETLAIAALGREFNPLDRAVDVHISHLRKKLGCCRSLIVTVRSAGYLLRLAVLALLVTAMPVAAQTEDIEPRTVGGAGVMTVGASGFVDKFSSREEAFPWRVTLHADFTRFVNDHVALRGGLIGTATVADDDNDESDSGPGTSAVHVHGGLAYYFTPGAMASLYAGGEYRAQLTDRAERDSGTVLGKGGIEAALSSRVALFVEGGYGVRLARGGEDERQTRIVGELGVRVKF